MSVVVIKIVFLDLIDLLQDSRVLPELHIAPGAACSGLFQQQD
jgi:hypothetical protein